MAKAKTATNKPKPAKKPAAVKKPKAKCASDGIKPQRKSSAPVGRPSVYTTALGDLICARLADGETLIAICRDDGFPSERTVRTWALDPEHEFSPKYTRARELGYHRMADEMLVIADDGSADFVDRPGADADGAPARVIDHEHVQRSRLRFEARKWLLSKALPKIYGDRVSAELTGADGAPLMPEAPSTRETARAILDIMREAGITANAPQD